MTVRCGNCKTVLLDNRPDSAVSEGKNSQVVAVMVVCGVMCLEWDYSGVEKCGLLRLLHFTRDSCSRCADCVIVKSEESVQNILELHKCNF